jgi:hypothetical protein
MFLLSSLSVASKVTGFSTHNFVFLNMELLLGHLYVSVNVAIADKKHVNIIMAHIYILYLKYLMMSDPSIVYTIVNVLLGY